MRRPVTGTLQGGVTSPLLHKVYPHRLDRAWDEYDGDLVCHPDDHLARWPSCRAMLHACDRIREITARRRMPLRVGAIVEDLA